MRRGVGCLEWAGEVGSHQSFPFRLSCSQLIAMFTEHIRPAVLRSVGYHNTPGRKDNVRDVSSTKSIHANAKLARHMPLGRGVAAGQQGGKRRRKLMRQWWIRGA